MTFDDPSFLISLIMTLAWSRNSHSGIVDKVLAALSREFSPLGTQGWVPDSDFRSGSTLGRG